MKQWLYLALVCLTLSSCYSSTSYSTLARKEKRVISDFLSRQKIQTTDNLPSEEAFLADPTLYYDTLTYYGNFYYRLDKAGERYDEDEGGQMIPLDSVTDGRKVVVRFIKYTLTEPSDTANYWTTQDSADPTEFIYNGTSATSGIPTGWHYAIGLMKYPGAECTIIVPSKLGDILAQNSVTPYGYRLRFVRMK